MNIQNKLMTKAERFRSFSFFNNTNEKCSVIARHDLATLFTIFFLIRIRWQLLKDIIYINTDGMGSVEMGSLLRYILVN